MLAAKADLREEWDRLGRHIAPAQGLLDAGGGVGPHLDFLVQQFMRETNTICRKSGTRKLRGLGLQMEGMVEQVREQVQNLE
jgi:uncharacterized protein (TIGR00255 family)